MERTATHEEGERWAPRIYAASLTDYNAGVLHGVWLVVGSEEELTEGIAAMLAASPTARHWGEVAEEWAIHDYDDFGSHLRLGEYEDLSRVVLLAEGLVEHGEAFGAWAAEQDSAALPSPEGFADAYCGEFTSLTEWGESLLDDLGLSVDALPGVPESLRPYVVIDVAAWARDMELEGDIYTVPSVDGVYVFYGNY